MLAQHVLEHRFRLGALDKAREETERRVSVLESQVVTEKEARMLRDALASALEGRSSRGWTRAQVVIAGLVGLIAVADLVRGLF